MNKRKSKIAGGSLSLLAVAAVAAAGGSPAASDAASARDQSTQLISRSLSGGVPNGPSTHAVISNDKRYARAIAFESDASDLVQGDTNGQRDVFAVLRTGSIGNTGSDWKSGRTVLMSRGMGGQPANGPSFAPAIDGGFHNRPSRVAFLSAASNLAPGDTNGKVDAFVSKLKGGAVKRVSLPGGAQATGDTTAVAISGNGKQVAYVTDGNLYLSKNGHKAKHVGPAGAADPSFSTGIRNDLVFAAPKGVYLYKGHKPKLVAAGGRNPAYNDIKRQVLTFEKTINGRSQVAYQDLGKHKSARIISSRKGDMGNGGSSNPVIGNAGYYVTFQSDASNLGVNALDRVGDENNQTDAYLYTDVRDITLVQSVKEKAVPVPGGGLNPSMSFYANYIVFDSPAPLDSTNGQHQIYMRYLGPV